MILYSEIIIFSSHFVHFKYCLCLLESFRLYSWILFIVIALDSLLFYYSIIIFCTTFMQFQ